jgi:RNA polymerase sigma-70 factor (ECF subfamily)
MGSYARQTGATGNQGWAATHQSGQVRLRELVWLHQEMVYNCAFRLLGNAEQAAEVTQQAFRSAHKSRTHSRKDTFGLRVLRLVACACKERQGPTERRTSEGVGPRQPRQLDQRPAAPGEQMDVNQELQAGILTLPMEERIVLVLADVLGLSYQDIGQVTKLDRGRVCASLGQGRSRLRDYLLGRAGSTSIDAQC